MKLLATPLFLCLLFFTSCSKKSSDPTPGSPANTFLTEEPIKPYVDTKYGQFCEYVMDGKKYTNYFTKNNDHTSVVQVIVGSQKQQAFRLLMEDRESSNGINVVHARDSSSISLKTGKYDMVGFEDGVFESVLIDTCKSCGIMPYAMAIKVLGEDRLPYKNVHQTNTRNHYNNVTKVEYVGKNSTNALFRIEGEFQSRVFLDGDSTKSSKLITHGKYSYVVPTRGI